MHTITRHDSVSTVSTVDAVGDLVEAMLGFHRALRRRGDEWGETIEGLSRTDVVTLGLLGSHGPSRPGRLAELLACDRSVVSRRLAVLDQAGLVTRAADPQDRRAELVDLSPLGRTRLAGVRRLLAAQLAERLDDWPADEVARATRLVSDLTERLVRPVPATT